MGTKGLVAAGLLFATLALAAIVVQHSYGSVDRALARYRAAGHPTSFAERHAADPNVAGNGYFLALALVTPERSSKSVFDVQTEDPGRLAQRARQLATATSWITPLEAAPSHMDSGASGAAFDAALFLARIAEDAGATGQHAEADRDVAAALRLARLPLAQGDMQHYLRSQTNERSVLEVAERLILAHGAQSYTKTVEAAGEFHAVPRLRNALIQQRLDELLGFGMTQVHDGLPDAWRRAPEDDRFAADLRRHREVSARLALIDGAIEVLGSCGGVVPRDIEAALDRTSAGDRLLDTQFHERVVVGSFRLTRHNEELRARVRAAANP